MLTNWLLCLLILHVLNIKGFWVSEHLTKWYPISPETIFKLNIRFLKNFPCWHISGLVHLFQLLQRTSIYKNFTIYLHLLIWGVGKFSILCLDVSPDYQWSSACTSTEMLICVFFFICENAVLRNFWMLKHSYLQGYPCHKM